MYNEHNSQTCFSCTEFIGKCNNNYGTDVTVY